MGCCLSLGLVKARRPVPQDVSGPLPAKNPSIAVAGSEVKAGCRQSHIIRLERKHIARDPPSMKIIYSKKIINRDDSDPMDIPKNQEPINRTQSADIDLAARARTSLAPIKAGIDNLGEIEVVKSLVEQQDLSFENPTSKSEESTSQNFIEVNELNFLSKLRTNSTMQPMSSVEGLSSNPQIAVKKQVIHETVKTDWLKQYNLYLNKQMEDSKAHLNFGGLKDYSQPIRPAIVIILPEESMIASQLKVSTPRSPVQYRPPVPKPIVPFTNDATQPKFSLSALRKRNQTAPHMNEKLETAQVTKVPSRILDQNLKRLTIKQAVCHELGSPEDFGSPNFQGGKSIHDVCHSKAGVGSADSINFPQFTLRRHVSPSVKSFHHSMKARMNEMHHASNGIIIEQDSEDHDDESIGNEVVFDSKKKQSMSKKLADLRSRNKTTLPAFNSGEQNSIFYNPKDTAPARPAIKETPKIKETEDESNDSELLGDRLFKGLNYSHSSQE